MQKRAACICVCPRVSGEPPPKGQAARVKGEQHALELVPVTTVASKDGAGCGQSRQRIDRTCKLHRESMKRGGRYLRVVGQSRRLGSGKRARGRHAAAQGQPGVRGAGQNRGPPQQCSDKRRASAAGTRATHANREERGRARWAGMGQRSLAGQTWPSALNLWRGWGGRACDMESGPMKMRRQERKKISGWSARRGGGGGDHSGWGGVARRGGRVRWGKGEGEGWARVGAKPIGGQCAEGRWGGRGGPTRRRLSCGWVQKQSTSLSRRGRGGEWVGRGGQMVSGGRRRENTRAGVRGKHGTSGGAQQGECRRACVRASVRACVWVWLSVVRCVGEAGLVCWLWVEWTGRQAGRGALPWEQHGGSRRKREQGAGQ